MVIIKRSSKQLVLAFALAFALVVVVGDSASRRLLLLLLLVLLAFVIDRIDLALGI